MKEILPGIYCLTLMRMVNVYPIVMEGGVWLVDTGTSGHGKRIVKAVNELAGRYGPLKHIAITHEHADHTGGAAYVQAQTGAKVWIHPADAGIFAKNEGVKVSGELQDNMALPFAPDWRVIHTPGHSRGQCCFYNQKSGVLIVGDVVMRWFGRLSLPFKAATVDIAQNIDSIHRLLELDFDSVLLAHGKPYIKGGKKAIEELVGKDG